ncbi:TPA: hypothetical protein EYP26_00925 [Candidatus Bathyarchaeota archaeon]|nr:hypothetical protein [Candidatus Bathyarchaeota archaeon]
MVGAEFWVDPEGRFYFNQQRGQDKSVSIRLEKGVNLLGLERKVDMVKLANRIWIIGAGSGADRVETFEEDAGSQAAYGLREAVKVDKEAEDEDAAKTLAQNLLALYAYPRETLTAILPSLPAGLELGDQVSVKDSILGVDGKFRVKRIEYEYDAEKGEVVRVELGQALPDLSEELLRIAKLERWFK